MHNTKCLDFSEYTLTAKIFALDSTNLFAINCRHMFSVKICCGGKEFKAYRKNQSCGTNFQLLAGHQMFDGSQSLYPAVISTLISYTQKCHFVETRCNIETYRRYTDVFTEIRTKCLQATIIGIRIHLV